MSEPRGPFRHLDKIEAPDRWDEISSGTPRSSSLPGLTNSRRVVAAIVAFAVFAPAAIFAWNALRPEGGNTAVVSPLTVSPSTPQPSPTNDSYLPPFFTGTDSWHTHDSGPVR